MINSIFVGHGAPTIIWEENEFTNFLKNYAKTISKPKGIIVFSAHWESPVQLIGSAQNYNMIYDFYGFPDELYKISYPATGDVHLAHEIQKAMGDHHIPCKLNSNRGVDRGAWTMLKLLYPEADIPVVTMSVNTELSPQEHYKIGQSLGKFKEQDYLIICSGGIVHNLRDIKFNAKKIDVWASEFNYWITDKVLNWDLEALFDYQKSAPNSRLAVPRNEHFINLLIALGTKTTSKEPKLLTSIFQHGNLSLDMWEFE
ncbi:MAG TPA: class III extradiol ring-cleavage dioxygenase [Desulfosporosinus sp.]